MKKASLLIFLSMLSLTLRADSLFLNFFQNASDNLFQNRYAERDQISTLGFSLDKDFAGLSIYSDGRYSHFFKNQDLSFYSQEIGLDYLAALNEKTALYFSAEGNGTLYKEAYSDFRYLSLNALAALKSYPSPTSILKGNATLEYRNYSYSVFDYVSQAVTLSFEKFFQTRTTAKAELGWGHKYFLHPTLPQETSAESQGQNFSGSTGRGKHRGMRPYVTGTKSQGAGIQNFSLTALIAQGIGDNLGLRISGIRQWPISGENPFTYIEEFYMVKNPSYDNFSWTGFGLAMQLTGELPWNIEAKLGYTFSEKEFPGIESMSLEGTSLGSTRKDKRNLWEARIEKNFSRFSLYLAFSLIQNSSTDPLFDWKGNVLSGGLEWNFFFGEKQ